MIRKTFLIDFDNTCAFEIFPEIGPDVPHAVCCLKRIAEFGHHLVLWTCRQGENLKKAVEWFKEHDIPLSAINDWTDEHKESQLAKDFGLPRKVLGDYCIDDKNLGCPIVTYYSPECDQSFRCVDWYRVEQILEKEGIFHQMVGDISTVS